MGSRPNRFVVPASHGDTKKLILAVADFAEYGNNPNREPDEPIFRPPPELLLAWKVQEWGSLAVFGNQEIPAGLLNRMTTALNVYRAVISYIAGSNANFAEWAAKNPGYLEIVTDIREMRQKRNGTGRDTH